MIGKRGARLALLLLQFQIGNNSFVVRVACSQIGRTQRRAKKNGISDENLVMVDHLKSIIAHRFMVADGQRVPSDAILLRAPRTLEYQ